MDLEPVRLKIELIWNIKLMLLRTRISDKQTLLDVKPYLIVVCKDVTVYKMHSIKFHKKAKIVQRLRELRYKIDSTV